MLKEVVKKYKEMSSLKKICLWSCYLVVMIVILKLSLPETILWNVIWQFLYSLVWLSMFALGTIGIFLEVIFSIVDKIIARDEQTRKEETDKLKKKVLDLFKGKQMIEITLSRFNSSIEAVILNEIETNKEISLFAKLVGGEIRILIQMKDGTIYPDAIFYTAEEYSAFFGEWDIL